MLVRRLFAIACLLFTVGVHAEAATKNFNIEAQPLAKALLAFSAQSNVAVMAPAPLVEGKRAPAVNGEMSAMQALEKLLRGSGLSSRVDDKGTVLITAAAHSAQVGDLTPISLRVAQVAETPAEEKASRQPAEETGRDRTGVPEILVQGSRVLNMDIARSRDDSQPYVIFERSTIERSGATNLGDFLKQRLPMNTAAASLSQLNSGNGNQSIVALRGLSSNETLILIDGHRAVNPSIQGLPSQSDINGISMAAVERIEILPTTASGIYGGGATGGVINIIMRRDYVGVETKLTYENSFATDTAQRKFDISAGFTLEEGKTSVLLSGSYSDANPFLMQERDFMREGRMRAFANNPNLFLNAANPPIGYTTNIRSISTNPNGSVQNLSLDNGTPLGSHVAYVPVGYAGVTAVQDGGAAFIPTAGRFNLDLANSAQAISGVGGGTGGFRAQTNQPEVKSFSATLRRPLSAKLQAFLDIGASNNSSLYASNNATGVYTIAAGAPNNPFAQNIRVTAPLSASDGYVLSTNFQRRAMAGLIMQLPRGWTAETDYTWDRSRSFLQSASNLASTIATPINTGAIDLLRDLNAYPVDLTSSVVSASIPTPYYATFKNAVLRASGPIARLPAGALNLSAMIERADLDISDATLRGAASSTFFPARSQTVNSAYMEARVPIIGSANAMRGARELELQLAGRLDDYSIDAITGSYTVGSNTPILKTEKKLTSVNPTIGLRYVPHPAVILRASYGTGFLPPNVSELAPIVIAGLTTSVSDPRRGGTLVAAPIDGGVGNPNLEPEESESGSAGIVFTPQQLPGLRLSLDYTRIEKSDAITFLTPQVLLNNEALFADRIVRAAVAPNDPYGVGVISFIDARRMNIARVELEAWDLSADYHLDMAAAGAFNIYFLGTRQTHYKTQLLPDQPMIENVGITATYPSKLKFNVGLDWELGRWSAGWTSRYISSYLVGLDAVSQTNQGGNGRVSSQLYHDVFGAYRLGNAGRNWLSDVEVRLGVKNVFDKQPPYDAGNTSALYYSFFGDPRGASYYLSVKSNF